MCGIAGIFNRGGAPVNPDLLVRMSRTLTHRGPDDEGYFINANRRISAREHNVPFSTLADAGKLPARQHSRGDLGLGHRRLSIIDLAGGHQPLSNENGSIWVAFNGEIYNFQGLKSDLETKGHRFKTNSDTETIVHAYEEWGDDCFKRFRGMFAIALWDENARRLLLGRDRIGKKPLYYLETPERFVFGSELKAILEVPEVAREIDLESLSDYLSFLYVPSPRSIFRSIRKLPAAHYALVTRSSFSIRQYWDLSFQAQHAASESNIMRGLLDILDEATRLRMISDVPLGAFLSGGVDSSAVVALMALNSREPVVTNSIAFSVSSYDETEHARKVAEEFSTNHNEFRVTPEAVPVVEKLSWHYDEPFADSSAIPTYYVSETARRNVTVALSGDGGDENFAGYRRYYFDSRENLVRNLVPGFLRMPIFGLLGRIYPKADFLPQIFRGKAFLSNVARDPVEAYFFTMSAFHEYRKTLLIKPDVRRALHGYRTSDFFRSIYEGAPARDHLSRLLYLDIKTYLCEDILTKVDRASMAVSLEVRCPLLDHVFMEYAAGIPPEMKLVGTKGKHVFKKSLRRHLPDDILYRKKMGFAVPIPEWLRGDLRGFAGEIILEGEATRVFLEGDYLKKMWSQHQSGLRNWSTELWAVMMLNLWYRNFSKS